MTFSGRRWRGLLVVALVAAALPGQALAAAKVYVVRGHGFGHGVGMSQYGAEGYARHGYGYRRILAHYYPGTELSRAENVPVRVLLATDRPRVAIASSRPFRVVDAGGRTQVLAPGRYVVGPTARIRVHRRWLPLRPPLRFDPGASPLALGGAGYRGSLRLVAGGRGVSVVNVVALERYLRGVVPSEMPFRWHVEALRAQAVAARSYALSSLSSSADFDLYADQRSQVYAGIRAERASTNLAVGATAGQVLRWQDAVARTYYDSSSGGRTAAPSEVWPSLSTPPYLAAVDDPYDKASPNHDWRPLVYSPKALERRFGIAGLTDVDVDATPSGRVLSVNFHSGDRVRSVSGAEFESRLGLRSTWFAVGVLGVEPASPVSVSGRTLSLSLVARGVHTVRLEWRRAGGRWSHSAPLAIPRSGLLSTTIRPATTSSYRLVADGYATAPVTVAVSPRLALRAHAAHGRLEGRLFPASAAGLVVLERLVRGQWLEVATVRVTGGAFRLPVPRVAGFYRARTTAGSGFSAGASPSIRVSARLAASAR